MCMMTLVFARCLHSTSPLLLLLKEYLFDQQTNDSKDFYFFTDRNASVGSQYIFRVQHGDDSGNQRGFLFWLISRSYFYF